MMRIVFGFAGFILFILFILTAYQNIISPGKLSNIEISNGTHTVQFLQMSHIATSEFYHQKQSQIQDLADEKYHFLLEGVGTGTQENVQKFQEYMGMDFDSDLYPRIAKYLGLQSQDRSLYSVIPDTQAHFVDFSLDTIVSKLDTNTAPKQQENIDITNILDEIEHSQNFYESVFSRFLIRSLLNIMIKNEDILTQITSNSQTAPLMQVILHERNTPIVDYIQSHSDQNIAVIYGALHFQGVFSALKQGDPNWKIIQTTSFTPYFEKNYPKSVLQNLLSWQLFVYSVLTFLILFLFYFYAKKSGHQPKPKNTKTSR